MREQIKNIFGIDLGTTYSSIAYVDEFGKPVIIPNEDNQPVTPSVVFFDKEDILVGDIARESSKAYPGNTVSFVKRVMGEPSYLFEYDSKTYRAEEVASFILRKVVQDAEKNLNQKITDIVITCPAYFGINEREATRRAGEIAGFNVRQIINEPTAAAIAYASLKPPEKRVVLVYDLGGGTFDITMIDIQPDSIEVICTGGDHNLGGKDWDDCFLADLSQEFQKKTGQNVDILDDPCTCQELQITIEKSKKALGLRKKIPVIISHNGTKVKFDYDRQRFEGISQALLERTISFTHDMLAEAKKKGYEMFDEIILVGGAARMPQVAARIEQEFSMKPRIFDPDGAVAKGAAIYGWKLALNEGLINKIAKRVGTKRKPDKEVKPAGKASPSTNTPQKTSKTEEKPELVKKYYDEVESLVDAIDGLPEKEVDQVVQELADETGYSLPAVKNSMITIKDVASKSFGIVVKDAKGNELVYNLIQKNTTVPVDVSKIFPTGVDNQSSVSICIMENEFNDNSVSMDNAVEIGTAALSLPAGLPSGSAIEIYFKLNEEGRLKITAKEKTQSRIVEVDIETMSVIQGKDLEEAIKRGKETVIT